MNSNHAADCLLLLCVPSSFVHVHSTFLYSISLPPLLRCIWLLLAGKHFNKSVVVVVAAAAMAVVMVAAAAVVVVLVESKGF
jgi:hypothetical protein